MNKNTKYLATDKMSDLICENYNLLLVMSRFGLSLGFGDMTVEQVCEQQGVHTGTFLAVVNFVDDEYGVLDHHDHLISLEALMNYLRQAHSYFLDFNLPTIRRKLMDALDYSQNEVAFLILKFFDEYVREVRIHMEYENQTVFEYVKRLLQGEDRLGYEILVFAERHNQIEEKLTVGDIVGGKNKTVNMAFDRGKFQRLKIDIRDENLSKTFAFDKRNFAFHRGHVRVETAGGEITIQLFTLDIQTEIIGCIRLLHKRIAFRFDKFFFQGFGFIQRNFRAVAIGKTAKLDFITLARALVVAEFYAPKNRAFHDEPFVVFEMAGQREILHGGHVEIMACAVESQRETAFAAVGVLVVVRIVFFKF
jgi:regulator of cell morphogenesis and NO signaling